MMRTYLRVCVVVALMALAPASLAAEKTGRGGAPAPTMTPEDVAALVDRARNFFLDAILGAAFEPADRPKPAPFSPFLTRDGEQRVLGDFRGTFVLVNFWATWCAPCVREMPSLDRAQRKLGDRLRVLAVAEDKTGENAVGPFLAARPPLRVTVLLDAPNEAKRAFHVNAIPTSVLIDRSGRIVATLLGAVDWDSPRIMAELEHYLAEGDQWGTTVAPARRRPILSAR
jgi:thiol-disulfide isomerase/thioredoxin